MPRKKRHEHGWTALRQRKFIETLAETASVRQAAAAVNMSRVSCYQLRNHPQGGDFKRAWDAAVDAGIAFLKDLAFERAVEGHLDPVWVRGEMKGYKRKYSDGLLMFLLRQYGQNSQGKRVTLNYFQGKATAGPGRPRAKTQITLGQANNGARPDHAAAVIDQFSGVTLDAAAEAEIAETLKACAARKREYGGGVFDAGANFVPGSKCENVFEGDLEPPGGWPEEVEPFDADEPSWVDDWRWRGQQWIISVKTRLIPVMGNATSAYENYRT